MTTVVARDASELGAAVRTARLSRGTSQAEVAHNARVGRQWLVAFEAGDKASAPFDMVCRVLAELELEVTLAPMQRVASPDATLGRSEPVISASDIIARYTKTPAVQASGAQGYDKSGRAPREPNVTEGPATPETSVRARIDGEASGD
ncbi:MAG: helix-turn-helix domain-containing protein [Bifidobacteriaceae bacterium]|jgi:transcriptional regulator with XRE-family HTH domain|nr:helix-turn-helix domain-containing protein [Bifidobacteriaceae bacterium]